MNVDNIAIHYYPGINCIAQCAVNLKRGKKIVFRLALKDPAAAQRWINTRGYGMVKQRLFIHNV